MFTDCRFVGRPQRRAVCGLSLAVDGWTKQQAIDEMTQGGFEFHSYWSNLVTFVNGLDVKKIKSKARLK